MLAWPNGRIVAKGSYSEKDAAALIRDMVRVVAHCHHMGVIHRWAGWGDGTEQKGSRAVHGYAALSLLKAVLRVRTEATRALLLAPDRAGNPD